MLLADLRTLTERVLRAGIEASSPRLAVRRHLGVHEGMLRFGPRGRRLSEVRRVVVLGAGKAAGSMAAAVHEVLGDRIADGVLVVPHALVPPDAAGPMRVYGGGHPLPDEAGMAATRALLDAAGGLEAGDHALVLLSGGASALLTAPAEGLTLDELRATTSALQRAGADIHDLNTVRRHMSAIAGGWLAAVLHPCPSWTLALSDVIGDDPNVIGSGPTVPDVTTFAHALAVLDLYAQRSLVPRRVVDHLERGARGELEDTPKPGLPWFDIAAVDVVGSVRDAIFGAEREAVAAGLVVQRGSLHTQGEAREVGALLGRRARALRRTIQVPTCLLAGGETTVTVRGGGRGGRNQELALAAAQGLQGEPGITVFSVGTDGIDGPTPAAGAVVDGFTWGRIRSAGLDPQRCLDDNDSHTALVAAGDALITGPTGTNVMDLMGCLVWPIG